MVAMGRRVGLPEAGKPACMTLCALANLGPEATVEPGWKRVLRNRCSLLLTAQISDQASDRFKAFPDHVGTYSCDHGGRAVFSTRVPCANQGGKVCLMLYRIGQITCVLLVVATLSSASHAGFGYGDVTRWVGTGDNTAALAVEFQDGKGNVSEVWGYRFDGTATQEDMLTAIVTDDTSLFMQYDSSTSLGASLFGLGYDRDNDGFSVTGLTFDSNGILDEDVNGSTTDSANADTGILDDADDSFENGWNTNGFWLTWTINENESNWNQSFGISSTSVLDNSWHAFVFDDDFSFDDIPAIPEPTSLALLGLGSLTLLRRRRLKAI